MFDLRRIPIVKVLLPFAGGSLAGHCILHNHQVLELLVATAVMWVFQLTVFHRNHNSGDRQCLFFLLTCSLLFFVGFATGTLTRPVDPDLPLGEKVMIDLCKGFTNGAVLLDDLGGFIDAGKLL